MKSPQISIITVVYNGEKYLEQTIKSVLNQTYENIEYIIIDGGSKDGTIDIIKKYEHKISHWISEPDKGLYDAMNKGISMTNGELIGMINSDDWYENNAIELIVKSYLVNPTKRIFHGDRFDVHQDGTKSIMRFNNSRAKLIYYGMTYNHPSMFVHKEIYSSLKYNLNLRALSDYEFVLRLFLSKPHLFSYIPDAYVNYRLDGISANMSVKNRVMEGYIARKNAGLNSVHNFISLALRSVVFYFRSISL